MKNLEFKNGFETISYDDLKLSLNEKMVSGKSINGMNHVDFIGEIENILSRSLKPEIEEIIVSNSGPSKTPGVSLLPYIEAIKGPKAIEAHVFRRLITSFLVKSGDPEWDTKFAISYNQAGIDIAMGAHVNICSNLSIFGYENYASTRQMPIEKIFEVVSDWVTNYEKKIEFLTTIMTKLKSTFINLDQAFQFIGLMTGIRVEKDSTIIKDYVNQNKIYPLNQGQISKFTEDVLIKYSETEDNVISAYELYNSGTNLHKASNMEIINIIPQNIDFGMNVMSFIDNKILV